MKRYTFSIITVGLIGILLSQTTGKIKGQVIKMEFIGDKQCVLLKDAIVSIIGTDFKDTTDFEGTYCILYVKQGEYSLKCEYKDYPERVNKFIKIRQGLTSTSDFYMYPLEIKLDSMHIDYDESYYKMWESQMITGVIKDESGNPIAGAIVIVEGTLNGAQTDENGIYQIQLKQGEYYLKCEHKDYQKKVNNHFKINEGKTTTLNIILNR